MDLIRVVVSKILKTKYEDLSKQTVDMIKKLVIDTLGTTIAGSSAEGSKELVDLIKGWGGREESTILVYGGKVPSPNAVLVNCTMARALDLDDVHESGGGHLAATFVPTAFVLAEYFQKPINGKELILAIAVGSDLSCRLRCALTTYKGWLAETFAPFGVVAMGGKIIGFDEERMINGMGLAYSQCSTNLQANVDGALSVRLQQGMGAKAGVLATILAERGFTGAKNVLQGVYGFYPLYARNEYDPKVITDQLGERFEILNTSLKPYPSCKYTHNAIYAILEILRKHNVEPETIHRISVFTNSKAYNVAGCGENKYRPQNIVEAQFSIPYTVAVAAVNRKVFIDDFKKESIGKNEVLEIANKVRVEIDPEIDKMPGLTATTRVELETESGEKYSEHVEFVKGHPNNPMTMDECVEKFMECARFSARPMDRDKINEAIRLICRLEEIDDVRKIVRLLVA